MEEEFIRPSGVTGIVLNSLWKFLRFNFIQFIYYKSKRLGKNQDCFVKSCDAFTSQEYSFSKVPRFYKHIS